MSRLDKIHGLQEEILKFKYSMSDGIRVGIANKTPSQTIIIFQRLNETEDTVALTGNLSKIQLVKGQCYKVSYTTGTKVLVQVAEIKK
ncbi:hypothetical protein CCE28_02415 [Anaeromicrobium sediminis]|uniref:Uncharacterized protein n=1 Tax=Anaeromicrobium sediminis TaxID=1478221 RepID=A0A267MQV6_9FIRM|nr:hypothetical protein CCE28_02415 [Anaeromicrobium sediminis]